MNGRKGIGALIGAALLTFGLAATAFAAAPEFHVSATKTADPPTVPAGGGDVTFTITVTNTSIGNGGSADFKTVVVLDDMPGCAATLSGPTGNGAPDTLAIGDSWTYTCTVSGVTPGTTNTATVNACKDNSIEACNNGQHFVSAEAQVSVGLCESDCGGGGNTDAPPTDTLAAPTGNSGPADSAWLLVAALGALLGSLVVLRPSRSQRSR